MNPLLVDSCKNSSISEKSAASNREASTSCKNSPEISSTNFVSYFSNEGDIKRDFLRRYEEVYDEVLLDPAGIYMTRQVDLDRNVFYQMIQKRPKIKLDPSYLTNLQMIVFQLAKNYLEKSLDSMKARSINRIAQTTSKTLFAVYSALEKCHTSNNILEQFSNSYHFPPKILQFFRDQFPCVEDLPAHTFDDYEVMTSPFTPNHDDEVLIMNTFTNFAQLIQDDKEVGRLLAMLVMFSPAGVDLDSQEELSLKKYQSQITIILYNHIINMEDNNNMSAIKRVSDLVAIIPDMYRCGEILSNNLIITDEAEEKSIEDIDVTQF